MSRSLRIDHLVALAAVATVSSVVLSARGEAAGFSACLSKHPIANIDFKANMSKVEKESGTAYAQGDCKAFSTYVMIRHEAAQLPAGQWKKSVLVSAGDAALGMNDGYATHQITGVTKAECATYREDIKVYTENSVGNMDLTTEKTRTATWGPIAGTPGCSVNGQNYSLVVEPPKASAGRAGFVGLEILGSATLNGQPRKLKVIAEHPSNAPPGPH